MSQKDQQCAMTNCTREAKPEYITDDMELTLCRDHVWDLFAHQQSKAREAMAEVNDQGLLLGPTKGFTYVVRMDNGNVKIGKAGAKGKATLDGRLQNVSNNRADNGGVPVAVLAVLPGGTSTELLTHRQWLHLRVSGRMEQFHADPSLLKWAEEQGICEEAQEAVDKFQSWQENKHQGIKGTKNHAAEWAEKLGIEEGRLTGQLRMDPRADSSQAEETDDNNEWMF